MYAMSNPGPRKVPPIFCLELKISIRSACKIFPPGRMNPSTYPRMGALSSASFAIEVDDVDVGAADAAGDDGSEVAVPRYPGPRTEKLSFIPLLDANVVISSMSAIVSLLGGVEDDADTVVVDGGCSGKGGALATATDG